MFKILGGKASVAPAATATAPTTPKIN
jgi:hypothetical protein